MLATKGRTLFNRNPERIRPLAVRRSRRAFLVGSSAVVGLPFLESLTSRVRVVAAQEVATPPRLFVHFLPNGNVPNHNGLGWQPQDTGPEWTMTDTLEPLANWKSKMLLLSGMNNSPALPAGAGGHVCGTAGFLICRRPADQGRTDTGGPSWDQLYAEHIGGSTRIASLALGTDVIWGNDPPWSDVYPRNISWINGTTPAGRIVDPPEAFDRMFEGVESTTSDPAQEPIPTAPTNTFDRAVARLSVLDQVNAEAEALKVRLNASDRARLDEYTEGLRRLETELQGLVTPTDGTPPPVRTPLACTVPERPTQYQRDLRSQIDLLTQLHQDIAYYSFVCNCTRVITFMRGNGGWDEAMTLIGSNAGHHSTSHHGGSSNNLATLQKWDKLEMQLLARMVEKMDGTDEGDGTTLLDNTVFFVSNELGDGNSHDQKNKLTLLFGAGAAGLQSGTHIHFGNGGREHAELYVAIMQGMGMDVGEFGAENKGPLLELQA